MFFKKNDLYKILKNLKINFTEYNHSPLFTVEDSQNLRGKITGAHTKNLFLKDKKGLLILLTCQEDAIINLKKIRNSLNVKNLSFAKEDLLMKYLGVLPGAVSPLALINDRELSVELYLDKNLFDAQTINFHPLVNTATINLSVANFIKFCAHTNHKPKILDIEKNEIISEIR